MRAFLDDAKSQKPSPHRILNQMLVTEQSLNLRLNNSRNPWEILSTTITTVDGTDTYSITQPISAYTNSGKVHFVVRATDDTNLPYVPVEFDDFNSQSYGEMPPVVSVNSALAVPEKISFYRTGIQDQVIKAVISPTPQGVMTYTVWFLAGSLDSAHALMSQVGPVSELSNYKCLKTAMALLPYCEWRDDDQFNIDKRKMLGAGFMLQLGDINRKGDLEHTVAGYISQLNAPKSFDMDHWNESK